MSSPLENLKTRIEPLRKQIINHKVYSQISNIEDLQIFTEHHVYAVWDFMSLLKTLQNNLTCTSVPWFPKGSADTRYLINEIVNGEESDIDMNGKRMSHFELYLNAMNQLGANTKTINQFLTFLSTHKGLLPSIKESNVPEAASRFVQQTFDVIDSNKDYIQSAVFTFGREDLIPNMFFSIINDLNKKFPDSITTFKYYLERHIEVDGDHHSHLALEMTSSLCGDNEERWKQAEEAVMESLQKRIELWDGVYDAIRNKK